MEKKRSKRAHHRNQSLQAYQCRHRVPLTATASGSRLQNSTSCMQMMDYDLMSRQNSKQRPLLLKDSPKIARFKLKYKSPYRFHDQTRAKSLCSSEF